MDTEESISANPKNHKNSKKIITVFKFYVKKIAFSCCMNLIRRQIFQTRVLIEKILIDLKQDYLCTGHFSMIVDLKFKFGT